MAKKKEQKTEKMVKPKAIGPYDIVKMMFTNVAEFDKLSNSILSRNFFMINRIMSIQYPLQAQCFNNLHVNNADAVKCWKNFIVSKLGYGKVPGFVFTKGAKASAELTNKSGYSKELKEQYCKFYKISLSDLEDMLYFNYAATVAHIQQFDDNNKDISKSVEKIKN